MVSNTRLYGATIAVVSGAYSLASALTGSRMGGVAWAMALLGGVVVVHGAILLTDVADRLGGVGGPLMVAYAVLMLLLQGLLAAGLANRDGMGSGMDGGMGGSPMTGGMGWDAGMVALAVLMLASGLVMTRAEGSDRAM